MATVRLIIDGVEHTQTSSGVGPVDAAFSAVRQIVKTKVKLEEYLVQAITRGTDDVGKVHIQIEYKGEMFFGFGANHDVVTASVEAFVDAVSNCLKVNRK
jgi:2-isopropylmalate synthase